MTVRAAFGYSRLVWAALCSGALVARLLWGLGSVTFTVDNFFAYLTVQSNIAFVVVSVAAGLIALLSRADPRWLTTARAIVLSYTMTAGIVFAFLLQQAGQRGVRVDVPWSDIVLHFVLPVAALVDWLVAPGRGRALPRTIWFAITYPIIWGVLTLVRGSIVGWYPYFFLDPAQVGGIGEFALYSTFALAVFAAVAALLVWISRSRPLADRDEWPA